MSLITFFQEKIKPRKLRGTGIINPINTSVCNENLSCIRQNDVNIWLYSKDGATIAIDSGYKDNKDLFTDFEKLNINPNDITSVFITHADIDHAGGIISNRKFAKNAKIYLHEFERDMLLGKEKRFKLALFRFKNPVSYNGDYNLFLDREIFNDNGIKIECFHIPGHTRGHSAFLVDDKYLFTGDSIAINENGGYCFFDFYNMNTQENIVSLNSLKNKLDNKDIQVYTSHNGSAGFEKAFANISLIAKGKKKKPFDKTAPYDSFSEDKIK